MRHRIRRSRRYCNATRGKLVPYRPGVVSAAVVLLEQVALRVVVRLAGEVLGQRPADLRQPDRPEQVHRLQQDRPWQASLRWRDRRVWPRR